jgi:hypothetical protein
MGLVLMAILARVNRIIGAQRPDAEPHTPEVALELRPDEDLGEAVARGDGGRGVDVVSDEAVSERMGVVSVAEGPVGSGMSPPKPKRKKRKAANAIDDLFSAIL